MLITVNIILDHDGCQGSECGACAYVCPTNVFVIKENKICVNSPQYCKLCYECLEICSTTDLNLKNWRATLYKYISFLGDCKVIGC